MDVCDELLGPIQEGHGTVPFHLRGDIRFSKEIIEDVLTSEAALARFAKRVGEDLGRMLARDMAEFRNRLVQTAAEIGKPGARIDLFLHLRKDA